MPVTPNPLLQRREFYDQRAPVWVANAEAIGLSSQQSAVVQTLVDDCRTAYDAAQAARIATATEWRFVDTAVPAGTGTATYRVSALKGGQQTAGAQSTAHFVFVGNGSAQLVIPPEADAA
ncbi:MAG: hypothetical protein ACFCBV_07805 [Phycisphaerales bacterium]